MDALRILREHEKVIIERFGVNKIAIFGSFAKGEEHIDSDVDVLIEFKEGRKTFDNYMELKFYLEGIFGRKVDLVIENAIKPTLRETILKKAVYA